MSFLAPLELLWLVPLAGALFALYFLRSRRQSREVSSLYLWEAIAQSSRADRPFERPKITALLLLQLLTLLLIAFALSQPTRKSANVYTNTVVILQNSASMAATDVSPNRFVVAKASAEQFLSRSLSNSEEAAVVEMGETPTVLCSLTSNKEKLISAIEQAQVDNTPANLDDTLTVARSLLSQKPGAIVIFGDGVWQTDDAFVAHNTADTIQYNLSATKAPSNVGIVEMASRADLTDPAGKVKLLISVDRRNSAAATLTVTVPESKSYSAAIVAGSGSITKVFTLDDGISAERLVTAKLTGMLRDDLSSDNTAWLHVRSTAERKVLLVTSGDHNMERALSLLSGVELYETTPDDYAATMTGYDLTVFEGWLPPNIPQSPVLVFGAINDQMPIETVHAQFSSPQIVDWDEGDSLLRYVDFSNIKIDRAVPSRLAPWGTQIADLQRGPAIVRGTKGECQIVWVAFDPRESNFALDAAFPIFLSNAADTLTSTSSEMNPSGLLADSRTVTELKQADTSELTFRGVTGERLVISHSLTLWLIAAGVLVILLEWLVYNRLLRYTKSI